MVILQLASGVKVVLEVGPYAKAGRRQRRISPVAGWSLRRLLFLRMLGAVVVENILLWSVSVPTVVFLGYLVLDGILQWLHRRRRHHHRH
jgi:hypothetical protein